MNYSSALKFLNSLDNFEKELEPSKKRFLGLGRVKACLKALGNPEKTSSSVLIGGSKGKGSTAFYLANSLQASGYKTGLYTSPHLHDVRERIMVNGKVISKKDFAWLATQLIRRLGGISPSRSLGEGKMQQSVLLTYFEFLTLIAFLYFKEKGVDIAILEAGLGGRLDATNVVNPLLTVITPISLEHTEILGKTLGRIAHEKSFLIHPSRPLVTARQAKESRRVLFRRAKEMKAPVFEEGKDFSTPSSRGRGKGEGAIRPQFLIQNFSLVLMALKILKEGCGFPRISFQKASQVFRKKSWPGRFELVSQKPLVLVDGAHNAASAEAFVKSAQLFYPEKRIVLVCGVSSDKDVAGILKALSKLRPKLFIATQFENKRALAADQLLKFSEPHFSFRLGTHSSGEAARLFKRFSTPGYLILAVGSLYLAAEIRKFYGKTRI